MLREIDSELNMFVDAPCFGLCVYQCTTSKWREVPQSQCDDL